MSNSAERSMESEPLKSHQEETGVSDGRGCAGSLGVSKLSAWRTAAFLLSMFICLSVVFAFSFVLPCPVRPQYLHTWNMTIPAAVTYDFLAVGDASKDKVLDVFFIYKSSDGVMNHTCIREGLSSPCLYLLAVDGTKGESLWERPLAAEFDWAECGVGGAEGKGGNLCVVAHADQLTAVDIYTGETIWQVSRSLVANGNPPVISLPDLNKDKTNDIAVLSYSTTGVPSVAELVFLSGKSGEIIGSKVEVGVAPGRMKSHLQFSAMGEAQYVLLLTDAGLYALSLGRLAASARSGLDANLKRDKSWEQRADKQGLVMLYDSVSLQSVLKVKEGSSGSLLLLTDSTVMLFDTQKLSVSWTTNTSTLISTPSFGHFTKDEVPDIVLEEDQRNNTKRVVILDGQKGNVLWEVFMPFHFKNPQPASVLTLNYFSVFMMWGETYTHTNNLSLEVEDRSSYLLHPLHSDVLLERENPTPHIIGFKALLLERGRHACYLVLSGEDGAWNEGAEPVVLTKRKIKEDVSESIALGLGGAGRLGGDVSGEAESVKEAFYRLRFSDQD